MASGSKKYRRSIRGSILALTLLFTLAMAVCITVISIRSLAANLQRTTLQTAEYALQTAANRIKQDIEEVDAMANWCAHNTSVRTYMLTDISAASLLQNVYPTVSGKFNSLRTQPYIQRFLIAGEKGRMMMFGTNVTQSRNVTQENLARLPGMGEEEPDEAWQRICQDPLMLPTVSTVGIPVVCTMYNSYTAYTRVARVYVSVSTSLITKPLQDFALAEGGRLYWGMGGKAYAVQQGHLVLQSEEGMEYTPYQGETLDGNTRLYKTQAEGEDYIVVVYPLGIHGLYLAEAIPTGPMHRQLPLMLGSLLVSVIAIVALGILLMLLMRRLVTAPVLRLQKQIEAIGRGDFTTDPSIEWDNELGDIGRGINSLSRNVVMLMDKRLEDEKQKQDLEYRMLQNQINPHFIYNSLNSIKWMATIQHASGIAEMVTALSRLLKSVSKGNERLVPLYEEFALLNDYFTIQQYRYGGTITLDVSYIENEHMAYDCLIPRFTLQPLVENAIFHGIEPKGTAGDIRLTVTEEKPSGDVLVCLRDNGVGMTPEQVEKALREPGPEEAAAKFRHVGLWNVHRRLQYSFGERYGLCIESVPGQGTTIIVRLPGGVKKSEGEAT